MYDTKETYNQKLTAIVVHAMKLDKIKNHRQ